MGRYAAADPVIANVVNNEPHRRSDFLLALLLTFDLPLYFPDGCRAGGPVKGCKTTISGTPPARIFFRTVRRAVANIFKFITGPPVR